MYVTSATEASVINTLMRVNSATIKEVISGPVVSVVLRISKTRKLVYNSNHPILVQPPNSYWMPRMFVNYSSLHELKERKLTLLTIGLLNYVMRVKRIIYFS